MKIFTIRNLLILISTLLLANLATWYWFAANLHLKFDAENFDHIVSPLSGLLAFGGVFFALRSSFLQNKIIQSQALRPYFERQIDTIVDRVSKRKFRPKIESEAAREYNGFDFTTYINDLMVMCIKDKEFLEDVEKSKLDNSFTWEYMLRRSYIDKVLILEGFMHGLHNRFEYDNIILLIHEINDSNLLQDEINQLIRRIERELMHNYMSQVRFLKSRFHPPIPVMNLDFGSRAKAQYIFRDFSDTGFVEYFSIFELEFRKAGIKTE